MDYKNFVSLPLDIEMPLFLELGLMFRESLGKDCGMLFVFDESAERSFYMKNTKIPLDIAFINENGIIETIKELTPLDETLVTSDAKVLYALEVNRGWFNSHGVKVGDKILNVEENSHIVEKKGPCWKGYQMVGTKKKGEKTVPNCVPVKEESKKRYCPKCKKNETRSECKYGGEYWDKNSLDPKEVNEFYNVIGYIKSKKSSKKGHNVSKKSKEIAKQLIDQEIERRDKERKNQTEENWNSYYKTSKNYPKPSNVWEKPTKSTNVTNTSKKKTANVSNPWKSKPTNVWDKNESITLQDLTGRDVLEIIDLIRPEPLVVNEAVRLKSKHGHILNVVLSWRGKYLSIKMFFPQSNIPTRSDIVDQLQKVYPGSRLIQRSIAKFDPEDTLLYASQEECEKNGDLIAEKTVRRSTRKNLDRARVLFHSNDPDEIDKARELRTKEDYKDLIRQKRSKVKEEIEANEDWQKVNRKDNTDGMSQKAVNAYRRENPGSKLKTAVTEKNPGPGRSKRRKSFCARSKGQQDMHNIDCSKNPDKPVCKARRRWKC
jgi:uncharacterized membrane protein (UPF0127 family)